MTSLHVDFDLVKNHNIAGPRYTSYPPATKFTDDFSREELAARIEANNRSSRDLSLYFHLPFCETLCWFCGCTTVISSDQSNFIYPMVSENALVHGTYMGPDACS